MTAPVGHVRDVSAASNPSNTVAKFVSAAWLSKDIGNFAATGSTVIAGPAIAVTHATATITLGNLTQTSNGTPRPVTATTIPTVLTISIIYAASATPPLIATLDQNGFSLTFTHPANLPGVSYGAESSDDLATWMPVPLELLVPGAVETLRARVPLNSGNPLLGFLRLRFGRP